MARFDINSLAGKKSIVLYYQGYCRKCQIISKCVVWFSLYSIKRVPLERKESIQLFFEDYPGAKGYPILFINQRPIYNYWVFPAVPIGIVTGWTNLVKHFFKQSKRHFNHKRQENEKYIQGSKFTGRV